MIALSEKENPVRPSLLPAFGNLFKTACWVNLPLLAIFLLLGRVRWAISEAAGFTISVLVCGILYLMVGRCMEYYVASVGGQGKTAASGATMQIAGLLLAKFLVLGLCAYAVMSIPHLNLIGVLIGFFVTHTAIIVAATRYLKTKH